LTVIEIGTNQKPVRDFLSVFRRFIGRKSIKTTGSLAGQYSITSCLIVSASVDKKDPSSDKKARTFFAVMSSTKRNLPNHVSAEDRASQFAAEILCRASVLTVGYNDEYRKQRYISLVASDCANQSRLRIRLQQQHALIDSFVFAV